MRHFLVPLATIATLTAAGCADGAGARTAPIGAALTDGVRLVYESRGAAQEPWVYDSVRVVVRDGFPRCVITHRRAQSVREHCARGDTLFERTDSEGPAPAGYRAIRPIGPGMEMEVRGASGNVLHYVTGEAEVQRGPGTLEVAYLPTTIVTRDSGGTAVRRLREHYAPALLTALWGAFEQPDGAGGWTAVLEFSLAEVRPYGTDDRVVTVHSDIPFTDGFRLDVHASDPPGGSPAVVVLHGASGGKASMDAFAAGLAAAGYVVFNAEWLSPRRPLDALAVVRSFEAAACAIRFAAARSAEYGAEAGPLVVVGKSAGGLGGAVVTLAPDEFPGGCDVAGPDPAVSLFIGLDGRYVGATDGPGGLEAAAREDPSLVDRLDPRRYLDRRPLPRIVLFVGDQFAPAVAPAEAFLAALRDAGVAAEIRRVTGPHDAETFTEGVLALLAESSPGTVTGGL